VTPGRTARSVTPMSAAERRVPRGPLRSVGTGRDEDLRVPLVPQPHGDERLLKPVPDGDRYRVVRPVGELDVSTAPQFESSLLGLLDGGSRTLVVDLRELDFCDAAGLKVFLRVRRRATAMGCRLWLEHPTRTVRRVLEVSDLGWLIDESPNRATG
jgi:anti-sigma B factor antagonist